MKKVISLILAFTLVFGIISFNAYAISESDFPIKSTTVFCETDFSKMSEGELLRKSTAKAGLEVVDKTEKGDFVGAIDPYDSGNMCTAITALQSTGARLGYKISPLDMSSFTVEYRTMAETASKTSSVTSFGYYGMESTKGATIASFTGNTWTYVKADFLVTENKINVYSKNTKGGAYTLKKSVDYTFSERLDIRFFANGSQGITSYFDDIKIYTYDRAPSDNSAVFLSSTFDDLKSGTDINSNNSAWTPAGAASFKVTDTALLNRSGNGGKLTASKSSEAVASASFIKSGYTHFSVTAFVYAVESASGYVLVFDSESSPAARADVSGDGKWHFVRFDIDEKSKYVRVMKDGVLISFEESEFAPGESYNIKLASSAGGSVIFDSVYAFDDDLSVSPDGEFDITKFVYNPAGVIQMRNILRNSHPRILITDFKEIYDKIRTDGIAKRYYELNFATAESKYSAEPTPFEIYQRPGSYATMLTTSTRLENAVMTFSCVYNIEKERIKAGDCTYEYVLSRGYSADTYGSEENAINEYKNHVEGYKARALEEIYNAGTYPTWLPETTLCLSEAANGVSIGYDWLYNYTTKEEHDRILDILVRYAASPFVQSYKNIKYGGWQTGKNNRTLVNAGASISLASSIYDIYPDAAEFIVQGAITAIPYGLEPYKYDGAFPEGPSYWSYSTDYYCIGQSILLSMIGDGETVPEYMKLYETNKGLDTTGDYFVNFNGPLGSFNFCDCSYAYASDSAMYYLAKLYNKPEYAAYNRALENRANATGLDSICSLVWLDTKSADIRDIEKLSLDKVYDNEAESSTVFLGASFRSSFDSEDASWAAIRGGANNSSHGYPNGGTFTFESHGVRWALLQDRHNYDDRSNFYNRRAEGCNTVIVNPSDNSATQSSSAFVKVLEHKESENNAWAILDMTKTNVALSSAKRGILLGDERQNLVVQDEFYAKEPSEFYWFMHTHAAYDDINIAADGKSAVLTIGDERLYIHLNDIDNKGLKLDKMASLPLAPKDKWLEGEAENVYVDPKAAEPVPKYGYKLFVHAENTESFKLSVELVPLDKGENVPSGSVMKYFPMSDWKNTDFEAVYPKRATVYEDIDTSWYQPSKTEYEISTLKQLAGLSYLVCKEGISFEGKKIRLTEDIDFSEKCGVWMPIGTATHPFSGTFDGNGKSILNFKENTQKNFFGLFGVCENATVKNFFMKKVSIDGGYCAAAAVAAAFGSDIENVSVEGEITGTYYIGGIAGSLENSRITNCVANMYIYAKPIVTYRSNGSGFVGGIAGYASESKIANSLSYGETKNLTGVKQMNGRIAGLSAFSELENVFYPKLSGLAVPTYKYSSYEDMGIYQYNWSSGRIISPEGINSTTSQMLSEYAEKNGYSGWTSGTIPDIVVASPDRRNNKRFTLSNESISKNTVSVDVKNVSDATAGTFILCAGYKDGVMVSYKMQYVTLSAQATQTVSLELDKGGFDTVLIFPWATLSGMYTNGNTVTLKK